MVIYGKGKSLNEAKTVSLGWNPPQNHCRGRDPYSDFEPGDPGVCWERIPANVEFAYVDSVANFPKRLQFW